MPDFWLHSGFHLADRDTDGRLVPSDDLLRAWWARPEVTPVEESCDAERSLHRALLADPRRPVAPGELAALQDPDARANYGVVLALRERLLAAPTLEAAYLNIFRGGNVTVPPLFIDQLAHMIIHGVLEGTEDALEARAAELFFRVQKVTIQDGMILLADAETVEMQAAGGAYGSIGRLLVEAKTLAKSATLDVLDRDNANTYWGRDERHDTVLCFNEGRAALGAYCRVVEKWVRHFFAVQVAVTPLRAITEQGWVWHIGLDAEASAILNGVYRGDALDPGRDRRILALFQLDFADAAAMRPDLAGRPVYLACAMNADGELRMKPQNLLLNLPLASIS